MHGKTNFHPSSFHYSFHFPFPIFFQATTVQIMAATQNPSLLAFISMPSNMKKCWTLELKILDSSLGGFLSNKMMCYKSGTGVVMHWKWDHLSWKHTSLCCLGSASLCIDGDLDSLHFKTVVVVVVLRLHSWPRLRFQFGNTTTMCWPQSFLHLLCIWPCKPFFTFNSLARPNTQSLIDTDSFQTQQKKGCTVCVALTRMASLREGVLVFFRVVTGGAAE